MVIINYHVGMDKYETLEQMRKSEGLSMREVAMQMGMTHQNIMRLEAEASAPMQTLFEYSRAIRKPFMDVVIVAAKMWESQNLVK